MTTEQRHRGLAGRTDVPSNSGMLFLFPEAKVRKFWMRGCLIPLDIAFLDADHRIVKMHTMLAEPDQAGRKTYSSDVPAQYALEVRGA